MTAEGGTEGVVAPGAEAAEDPSQLGGALLLGLVLGPGPVDNTTWEWSDPSGWDVLPQVDPVSDTGGGTAAPDDWGFCPGDEGSGGIVWPSNWPVPGWANGEVAWAAGADAGVVGVPPEPLVKLGVACVWLGNVVTA